MKKITVKEAAKITGMTEQFIRIGLQRERLPFGFAVKLSSKWTYHITPEVYKYQIKEVKS